MKNVEINENWVEDRLALDENCELESIVMVSQTFPTQSTYDRIDLYVNSCGGSPLPVLTITGDVHPSVYCMTRSNNFTYLTVEAFRSGPIRVTVIRDPSGANGDFFHVKDTQTQSGNYACPNFE